MAPIFGNALLSLDKFENLGLGLDNILKSLSLHDFTIGCFKVIPEEQVFVGADIISPSLFWSLFASNSSYLSVIPSLLYSW